MQLKEFSLISPAIELGTVFKALETAIPAEAISQAIIQTHSKGMANGLYRQLILSKFIATF